jgi:UPF0716 family protein affecting phage T7 exclusion
VPLSEHEQRLLEQMERALYAEDPKFATSLRQPTAGGASRKRLVVGALVVIAGLALLVTGVAVKIALVGVLGFVAMLAGVVVAFTGGKVAAAGDTQQSPTSGPSGKAAKQPKAQGGGFMDRMEDRWRHRREGDQQ